MNTTYQTLIVKFSEPITALDGIFDDTGAWGTDTLKGWIDDYESTRFTATDSHTAVITSEYNMECVKEWLQRQTPHFRNARIFERDGGVRTANTKTLKTKRI